MKTAAKDFKMTELGPIPKDWEVKRLGEIGTFSKGSGISRDQAHTGWLPCIRYGEIYTDHNDWIRDFRSHITSEIAAGAKLLNAGDILFAGSGETKEEIGKAVAYLGGETSAYCGGDILVLSPHSGYSSKYLGYVLNSRPVVVQKASRGQGDAVVHIKADSLAEVFAPIPPLSEQRKIAAALSDVDEMIAALEKLIEKKRKIKTGAMQRLLTGKTRLPGFKGAWVEKRFEDVFVHVPSKTYQIAAEEYLSGGLFPVVDQGQSTVVGFSNRKDKVFRVNEEGVIVFGDHTRIIKYVNFDFVVGADGTQLLLGNSTIADTRFLSYCLERLDIPNLGYSRHFKYVKDGFYVVPPTLSEQKAIAKVLGDMDEEIAALEAELAKTRKLKQGMMQELLTGKVRLR